MSDTEPFLHKSTRILRQTEADASDTVKLTGALVDFVLALANVDAKFKAGAKLLQALFETAAKAFDSSSSVDVAVPTMTIPRVDFRATQPDVPLAVNLQAVLNALRIKAIAMNANDLLNVLAQNVFLGDDWGICGCRATYIRSPARWKVEPWVSRILEHATLSIITRGDAVMTIDIPGGTNENSGKLGTKLMLQASPTANLAELRVGNRHVADKKLDISVEYLADSRKRLRARGVRMTSRQLLSAFEVRLAPSSNPNPVLRMLILLEPTIGVAP
jgi:hypothetical protein